MKTANFRERNNSFVSDVEPAHHVTTSSAAKCFSQMKTLSFFISSLKPWSKSLVFLISPRLSCLHFAYDSSFAFGNFQIPIPFFLRLDPRPNTAQFSPGIIPFFYFIFILFLFYFYFLFKKKEVIQLQN